MELSDQARKDSDYIRALNENAEKSVEQILQKVNNIRIEEQILIRVRKDIHKVRSVAYYYGEMTAKNGKNILDLNESRHQYLILNPRRSPKRLTVKYS